MKNCLLVGLGGIIIEEVKNQVAAKNINLFGGGSLQDVKVVFGLHAVDIVIIGAGLPLNDRLEIVRYIFETSNTTSVHMKDRISGPEGFLPFVNQVLAELESNKE